MILDQNLSYQFDMSENSAKKVQTSESNCKFRNSKFWEDLKFVSNHKNILQFGKNCGKVAKGCGKLQKDAESCGVVKSGKVAISATSTTARNFRRFDFQCNFGVWVGRGSSMLYSFSPKSPQEALKAFPGLHQGFVRLERQEKRLNTAIYKTTHLDTQRSRVDPVARNLNLHRAAFQFQKQRI